MCMTVCVCLYACLCLYISVRVFFLQNLKIFKMFLSFNNVIDEIGILQIKSWDSAYRFAASLPPDATPKKRVFNRRRLLFASLPTRYILCTCTVIHTNI